MEETVTNQAMFLIVFQKSVVINFIEGWDGNVSNIVCLQGSSEI
jgi:hypothetical protein